MVVNENSYLAHYGVLGMKWGVRKNPQRARDRANRKLVKLDKKVSKARAKSRKAKEEALNKQAKADTASLFKKSKYRKAANASTRSQIAEQKVVKKQMKAHRWAKSMEKAFENVKVSDSEETAAIGKKYLELDFNELMRTNIQNFQASSMYRNEYYSRVR